MRLVRTNQPMYQRKELADAKNIADSTAYQAERLIKDLGDKVPAETRSDVQSKIDAVRLSMNGDDLQKIRTLTSDMQNALNALNVQSSAQPEPEREASGGTPPAEHPDGDVVEGEFKEV